MLIFFDIDATLLTSGGVGIRAMVDAGRELFGPSFTAEGIPFAGRLDPLILSDMLVKSGQRPTPEAMAAMRRVYRRHLEGYLARGPAKACPGVFPLLDRLAAAEGVTLGLLTGNFEETGSLKLRSAGIEPGLFHIHVWGDDSPHEPPSRDQLPGIGLDRYRSRFSRAADPRRTVIIGDTPHDVACARAHNCRALGVATGQFTREQLAASGADRAVDTLAATDDIATWLLA